ncbi:MAG: phospholipid carrier-dependent glycosyltransferase [Nitrospirae bacterium]|nr:phospholipid carrier-dependent glycosyltransferase [Nitrospirota bacterium]
MDGFYSVKSKIQYFVALSVLCVAFVCIAVGSVKDDSLTIDELGHLLSGYAALREQNFSVNIEHTPLFNMIGAIPMIFQKINYDSSLVSNNPSSGWERLTKFFYMNKDNFDTILFSGRLTLILFHTFFLFVTGMLLKQLVQPVFAWLVIFFIAFEPNFLAHARYITTDAGLTIFSLLSLVSFAIFLKKKETIYTVLTAVFLGAALISKISGILVYLSVLAFMMYSEFKQILKPDSRRIFIKRFTMILTIPWVIAYMVYFVAALHINTQEIGFYSENGIHSAEVTEAANIFLRPVVLYKVGFKYIANISQSKDVQGDSIQYLNGEIRNNKGWWYYFPLVLLYKETPVMLILFSLCLILYWREKNNALPHEKMLLFYNGLCFCIYITSNYNKGIRHMLPMIASLTLLAVLILSRQQFRFKRHLLYLAAACELFIVVSVYPYFPAYFNIIAGGPDNGYKHLLDSNLDWGQNLKRLYFWAQENKIESMTVHCWMSTVTDLFDDGKIFKRRLLVKDGKPTGYLAISITSVMLGKEFLPKGYERLERMYLKNMKPIAIVAHSYFVYHFP